MLEPNITNQACCQVKGQVPVLEDIPYELFFKRFLIANQPCLFTGIITEWRSIKEWVDDKGRPDYMYLAQNFGNAIVPVANCRKEQYGSQPKEDMPFGDFLKYWQEHIENEYSEIGKCLYLKDWHFTKQFPDYEAYQTPIYFTSDWLNEFWDCRQDSQSCDDYRFVYMGPKKSWTPLHADVFRSFSWSANICGRKHWLLYPPGQEEYLRDKYGNLPFDVTSSNMNDESMFPRFSELENYFEVIQNPGEVIFVPSGWYHQVFNLEDTISINHNWFNGCNVNMVWNFLKSELSEVQKSISDCKGMDEWEEQCQLIMKSNTGIDYAEFSQFLITIAQPRIQRISDILAEFESKSTSATNNSTECQIDKLKNLIYDDDLKKEQYFPPVIPPKNKTYDVAQEIKSKEFRVFNRTQANDDSCDLENHAQTCYVCGSNCADRLPAAEEDIEKLQMNRGHGACIRVKRSEDEVDWEKTCTIDLQRCLLPDDRRHLVFDLRRLKDVISKLLMELEFKFVKPERLMVNPVEVLDKLKTILTKVENLGLSTCI